MITRLCRRPVTGYIYIPVSIHLSSNPSTLIKCAYEIILMQLLMVSIMNSFIHLYSTSLET